MEMKLEKSTATDLLPVVRWCRERGWKTMNRLNGPVGDKEAEEALRKVLRVSETRWKEKQWQG